MEMHLAIRWVKHLVKHSDVVRWGLQWGHLRGWHLVTKWGQHWEMHWGQHWEMHWGHRWVVHLAEHWVKRLGRVSA